MERKMKIFQNFSFWKINLKFQMTAVVFIITAMSVFGQSNKPVPLDRAIKEAADNIDARITAKSKIALINFSSSSILFSNYVLDELTANLVNSGQLIVVDRKEIDLIREELKFQYSGDVDDNSMQELGHMLGAQAIVSGSLTDIGGSYRIVIRVLNVKTTVTEVQYRTNIVNDNNVRALLGLPPEPPKKPPTTGEKLGTGAANLLLGLGSYLEGDIAGGVTLTAGYAVAAGLVVVEMTVIEWDSPIAGIPGTVGIAVAGLTAVYGFVRPFIYNRSPSLTAVMDNTRFGIAQTSDTYAGSGALVFQLSYSIKF